MKKSFAILLLCLFVSGISYSQKTYTFEYKVHPKKTYILQMDITSKNETTVEENVTKTESSSKVKRTTTTKEANAEGWFPAIMAFEEVMVKNDGKEVNSPIVNTIIEGLMNENNQYKIDTIINPKLDKVTREALKTVFADLKPEIDFPKTPLKIGDSFTQDTPMTIPLYGQKIKLMITKTYTLRSVLNGMAEFSVEERFDLSNNSEEITVAGEGSGVVFFNMKENQVVKDDANYTINLRMKTVNGLVLGYMNSKSKKSTVIN